MIKRLVMVLFDILVVNLSYYLALVIRFYVNNEFSATARGYVPVFWKFAPHYTVICIAVFACFKLYNNRWKHAGLHDLHGMLVANALTALIHVAGTLIFVQRMPITYYVIGSVLQFVLITASRFAYRFFVMESIRLKNWNHAKINVMIVGIGETARIFRSQKSSRKEQPNGNLGGDGCLQCRRTHGLETGAYAAYRRNPFESATEDEVIFVINCTKKCF